MHTRVGNREANRALYMTCLARMRRDPRTEEEYEARRTAGEARQEQARDHPLSKALLVAREVYRVLLSCGGYSSPTGPREEPHSGVTWVNSAVEDPQIRLRATTPARITSGQLKMDPRKVAPSVRALT